MNQVLKTKFSLRVLPFAMAALLLFSTTVAQPVRAQSILDSVKCATLSAFASASSAALKVSQSAMTATFQLSLTVLQDAWQLEDSATAAIRSVSENAFIAGLNAFENIPGLNAAQKSALNTYQVNLIKDVHVLETNVDAAEAAYREDILALVKSYEDALGSLVNSLITTINNATATAKANCSNPNVVATLVAVISSANATLLAQSIVLDVQDIAKATTIAVTRNKIFIDSGATFVVQATTETLTLTKVILTGKAAS